MSVIPEASARPRILFLSINDGSDTRINKEMATLSRKYAIDYVGISPHGNPPFFASLVRRFVLIKGRSRSPITLAKLCWRVLALRWQNRYDSVHVINEDLYLILMPWLFGLPVVLDVFDSSFLKWRMPRWVTWLGQRLSYALPTKIIVTDDERAALMPCFAQAKLVVIPNYPFRYDGPFYAREPAVVRILYAGSLLARRGTHFLERLLAAAPDVRVVMAGWIRDEPTHALAKNPRVEWKGLLPQRESIAQATRCDFILCHYEPLNLNNIYASPNKIYDAIQAGAAIIINPEARISRFVREQNLGVVLDAYEPADFTAVAESLRQFKAHYQPNTALRDQFLWENVEGRLMEAHTTRNG